ncbi:MAG: tetratricopeptide repeat protein [Candidatus Krumholzibacteriia bacterium]
MGIPVYLYLLAAAVIAVLGALFFVYRGRRRGPARHDPYIDALKLLVDGDSEAAFARLQESVKGGTAPTDAYIKLGSLLRDRGDVSKALQIHQSLTVKTDLSKSEKVELYLNLAADYARMGSPEKSIRVLDAAVRNLGIKEPDVLLTLAARHRETGDDEKAYEVLREARKLGGVGERELALFLTSAAETLVEKNEPREARKLLQRALKHDPECAPCLLALGDLARDSNDLDNAIDHWKRVAVLSPELSGAVLPKLESTLFDEGRFSEIEKVYDQVRSARAEDEAANLALARFYKKQGRGEEAIELLESYVAARPQSIRASLMLTSFYSRLRDAETVEGFLDKSIREVSHARQYSCNRCEYQSATMRWHCPNCNSFDSFSSNNET